MCISVIIPSYNRGWCLEDTVMSASYADNNIVCEILVVDNGSDDNSFEIIERLSSSDSRIRWVDGSHLPKNGNAARNLGFRESSGDYIQYLDSDDQIVPGKLEAQLDWLKKQGSKSITTSQWVAFTDQDIIKKLRKRETWKDYSSGVDLLKDLLLRNQWFCPGTWLLPRYLCEVVGPWDEACSADQDRDYFMRLLIEAENVYCYPEEGFRYRVGSTDHVSNQTDSRHQKSRWLVWQKTRDMLLSVSDASHSKAAVAQALIHLSYSRFWNDASYLSEAAESFNSLKAHVPLFSRPYFLGIMSRLIGLQKAVKIRRKICNFI